MSRLDDLPEEKTRGERNRERIADPQVGDYWHEMFCPYFVVVAEERDGSILICDETKDVGENCWTWDLEKCRYATKADLRKRVTYDTMPDKFVANVSPEPHAWVADAYAEIHCERTFADLYD